MYRISGSRMYVSREGLKYKKAVEKICSTLRIKPLDGLLSVSVDVYRPQRRGDLDNTFKCLFDSLNGFLWIDDKQIVEIHARRFDDKLKPRVEVEIRRHVGETSYSSL